MRNLYLLLLSAAAITFCFGSCDPDDVDPCEDIQCGTHETHHPITCDCMCEEGWCGPDCDIPVVDCVHGSYDHTVCACDCLLDYCGETCETLIQTCVNGSWDSSNCECECEDGWTGIDCSELDKIDNIDSYLQFELIEVTDGIETNLATINQINLKEGWEPTSFQSFPPLMANFWEGGGNLFIDFTNFDIEVGFYPVSDNGGVEATLYVGDQPSDFWGHAVSGELQMVQDGQPYHGLFNFIITDDTGEDTVKVVNGVFNSWEPE